MESAVFSRSFNGTLHSATHASFLGKPAAASVPRDASRIFLSFQPPQEWEKLIFAKSLKKTSFISYLKAAGAENTSVLTSDATSSEVKIAKSTFPNGFEALLLGVCDETDIAEVKLKVGQFEMHLKRNVGSLAVSAPVLPPVATPVTPPPASTKPKVEASPGASKSAPKKSISPFCKSQSAVAAKLAALGASGSNSYVLVSSPTVGRFRSGRTLKGKKQPPCSKEGDMINAGQTVGFLEQFGTELPVRSEVAGEILKVLNKDGEPVGYGDPLVAILPSFHGIQ